MSGIALLLVVVDALQLIAGACEPACDCLEAGDRGLEGGVIDRLCQRSQRLKRRGLGEASAMYCRADQQLAHIAPRGEYLEFSEGRICFASRSALDGVSDQCL
jgi:hypothetical protein